MKFWPEIPAEVMTPSARRYLLIVAGYCWAMAIGLFLFPDWFGANGFRRVLNLVPFQLVTWGIIHTVVGAIAFRGCWRGSAEYAYKALMATAVVVGVWAFGFWWAVIHAFTQDSTGPWLSMTAYTSMTLFHLVQARKPIRSPFEPVLIQINEE